MAAPLDQVPVFAKAGAIVSLLSEDVETVVSVTDKSVVSAADRASLLELRIFAGGDAKTTLDDGSEIEFNAPTTALAGEPGVPTDAAGPRDRAPDAAAFAACARCYRSDPAARVVEVVTTIDAAVHGTNVQLAPMSAVVRNSNNVKRYLLRIRY